MNKKILIWLAAILAVVLIALCIILIVMQTDISDPPVETAATDGNLTTTEPAGESVIADENSTTVDPTEGYGETVNQPDTDIADSEISIDELLNPGNGNGEASFGGGSNDNVFADDAAGETEPATTEEAGGEIAATTEASEDTEVTETTQPNVTEVSNDGYSNNWY